MLPEHNHRALTKEFVHLEDKGAPQCALALKEHHPPRKTTCHITAQFLVHTMKMRNAMLSFVDADGNSERLGPFLGLLIL